MLRWPFVLSMLVLEAAAAAQERDLTKEPALYVVGYAHLDTQWRWEYPQTISEFLPKTMHDNFAHPRGPGLAPAALSRRSRADHLRMR